MGEHVAIEGIERGVVVVGNEYAFAEIVQHQDARRAPPNRRKAFSWSSAQMRVLDRNDSSRTALRL